ncbi:hypothetical protein TUMEXPCC7403_08395 [Tumidithrix helvetica PCC 7403]|uniref:class I SAM-dependent methyltransferase n=1 Tax=Tumidithrix helvetica TaxID=3457545 RepID=UPI003CA515EE
MAAQISLVNISDRENLALSDEIPAEISEALQLGLQQLLQGQESEAQFTWMSVMAMAEPEQIEVWTEELVRILDTEAIAREATKDFPLARVIRQYIYEFSSDRFDNLCSLVWLSLELDIFSSEVKAYLLTLTQIVLSADIEDMLEASQILVDIASKLLGIHPFHGLIELVIEKFEGVSECQTELLEIRKQLSSTYYQLGTSQYQQQQFAPAFRSFQKVLELPVDLTEPHRADLNFNCGVTLAKLKKFEDAIAFFQAALTSNPNLTSAQQQLSKAKYEVHMAIAGYQFTQDWFSWNIPTWEVYFSKFKKIPHLNFLEVGCWEGRATCWLLENVLTEPTHAITCIDTFAGEDYLNLEQNYLRSIEARFDFNVAQTRSQATVTKIVGNSQDVLRNLPLNTFDLAYIDGSHLAVDVLTDAVLTWSLVKVGGTIIFDDYDYNFAQTPEQNTGIAVDAFVNCFCHKVKLIHKANQVILEKIAA